MNDWLEKQYWVSLEHLRSLPPELLSPVARQLIAAHDESVDSELQRMIERYKP